MRLLSVIFILCLSSSFVLAASCGDGVAGGGEECDGADLRGYTCMRICYFDADHPTDYVYNPPMTDHGDYDCGGLGTLSCGSDCTFASTCHEPLCGDGIIEGLEECDNAAANSDTVADACRTDCVLPGCGDGVIDTGEDCDDAGLNSDAVPNACRMNCGEAYCGDGVIDEGEECDDATAGCNGCIKCYMPADDLYLTEDSALCGGTYQIGDRGAEGVIIISGSDITVDCAHAVLVGPGPMGMQQQEINNPGQLAPIPTTTTIRTQGLPSGMRGGVTTPTQNGGGLSEPLLTTTTTIKATTTTVKGKATTTIPVLTHMPSKATTTTQKTTTTTLKSMLGNLKIPLLQTTTTTLGKVNIILKSPVLANPGAMELNIGTGIRITGDNVVLLDCVVREYKYGVKVAGSGNVLVHNRACDNTHDIKAEPGNYGTVNHCDTSSNWYENGQTGCTFRCDGNVNQNPCGQITQQQEPEDAGGGEPEEGEGQGESQQREEEGFLGRIFGILF
jgi:hypothetical protein